MSNSFMRFFTFLNLDTVHSWVNFSTSAFAIMWTNICFCFLFRILAADGWDLRLIRGNPEEFNPLFPRGKSDIYLWGLFYFLLVFVFPYSMIAFLKSSMALVAS